MNDSRKISGVSPVEYGSLGGKRRAEVLPPAERRRIASEAAAARWKSPPVDLSSLPKARNTGHLTIGDMRIPCAVLEDGRRVVSEHGITTALGSRSGASKRKKKASAGGGAPLPIFLAPKQLEPFIPNDLLNGLLSPVLYRVKDRAVAGFEATLLPEICNVWLRARESGLLQEQQLIRARKADVLMRGLAHVGIIALVDEATGYQDQRARDELHKILEAYIAKELLPWTKRFPDEFYKEMFRIWGWPWPPAAGMGGGPRGPRYAGKLTRQLIYENLPSGILEELEKQNPADENWQRRHRFPQLLTSSIGQPHLDKLVAQITMLFRLSDDKGSFWRVYKRAFPKQGDQFELLPEEEGLD